MFTDRSRLLIRLSLILVVGFLAVSLGGYLLSRDTLRANIVDEILPLTADNIHGEIQKDILRPVFISSLMANDTFVRDWLIHGEQDAETIARYLREIKENYGAQTSFLVSGKTGNYYFIGGVLKQVKPSEPRDAWFYRVRDMQAPYELNVDPDAANRDLPTIFVNYRVLDYDGHFLAAAGVGLPLAEVTKQIDTYEKRYRRRIYFVDSSGRFTLTSASFRPATARISELPGIGSVAERILRQKEARLRLDYEYGGTTTLVSARFIPELNWYLIVEQEERNAVAPLRHALLFNLAISLLVTLLVLGTAALAVQRYQRQLENTAATDPLTGVLNRHAFDVAFAITLRDAQRHGQKLSAILIDIDHFKRINDTFGHLTGDRVLRRVADIVRRQLREADVMVRWGGEEFLVLLKDCPIENAVSIAEKLRTTVAGHDFGPFETAAGPQWLTISLGVTTHVDSDSPDSLFSRADLALYMAKRNGRNRVEAAEA